MLRGSWEAGLTPAAEAAALSGWIRAAWTAFAAAGDPGWTVSSRFPCERFSCR